MLKPAVHRVAALQAHSCVSSLLARALNYPDAALVGLVRSGEFAATLLNALESLEEHGVRAEFELLRQVPAPTQEGFLLELQRDYTRMFFASAPRLAYLFESVYREGGLLQESTFEVARLYRDAGLAVQETFTLPPDHIAVELEFLSFLFFKELEGANDGEADAVEYAQELRGLLLERHLQAFALHLAERMSQHARCQFYKVVGGALHGYFAGPSTLK